MTARKPAIPILFALALAVVLSVPAGTAAPQDAFDRLKALEGTWEARDGRGDLKMRATYETVAGGSALVERLYPTEPGHGEMVTLYHRDGDDLVLTHYCTAGNQPTLVATAAGDRITFRFRRATNLASLSDGHMDGLEVTFQDEEHFVQEWMWKEGGEIKPNRLEYGRVQ
jgi:hypothetical protein